MRFRFGQTADPWEHEPTPPAGYDICPPPPDDAVRVDQKVYDAGHGWTYVLLRDERTGLVYYEFAAEQPDGGTAVFWACGNPEKPQMTEVEKIEATNVSWEGVERKSSIILIAGAAVGALAALVVSGKVKKKGVRAVATAVGGGLGAGSAYLVDRFFIRRESEIHRGLRGAQRGSLRGMFLAPTNRSGVRVGMQGCGCGR
jgi:hypothetical protein